MPMPILHELGDATRGTSSFAFLRRISDYSADLWGLRRPIRFWISGLGRPPRIGQLDGSVVLALLERGGFLQRIDAGAGEYCERYPKAWDDMDL